MHVTPPLIGVLIHYISKARGICVGLIVQTYDVGNDMKVSRCQYDACILCCEGLVWCCPTGQTPNLLLGKMLRPLNPIDSSIELDCIDTASVDTCSKLAKLVPLFHYCALQHPCTHPQHC